MCFRNQEKEAIGPWIQMHTICLKTDHTYDEESGLRYISRKNVRQNLTSLILESRGCQRKRGAEKAN